MSSASAFVDTVALMLFQNLREGIESGRIANLNTVQTEVEAAIAELNRKRLPEEPSHTSDPVGTLLLEIGSLHEKVGKCESQLSEFQSQAKALKEDTTQIIARAEACTLLVEQQQKEKAKVLAAMEGAKATIPTASPVCIAPASSPTDPTFCPAPCRVAIVAFPGGPRTVTIHPPDSPSYQSTVRDEKGEVIVDFREFRRHKPLRREGAFRGPIEDIDWVEITRVCGRGPEPAGPRAVPPVPTWPDRSQPPSCPPPPRNPSDLIARQQRQLSTSMQTDPFGRVLPPEYLHAKSPSLPTGISSSSSSNDSSHDPPSSPSAKPAALSTPSSTPPSPSLGRGKKRTRNTREDESLQMTAATERARDKGTDGSNALLVDLWAVAEPTTPTPSKREEMPPPEGPARRKKPRVSAPLEGLSARPRPLVRTRSMLDVTRAD